MKNLSKADVLHIAELAKIPLKKDEITKLRDQLLQTIKYINALNELDTKDIKPTSHVGGLVNIDREDSVSQSLSQDEALMNAPNTYHGYFKVKSVLNKES